LSTILSQIAKEAFEIQTPEYIKTVGQAVELLEGEKGKVGNLRIKGRLVEVEPTGEALVVGDLHGDFESLVEILQQSNVLERMGKSTEFILVFLGDYGDRGACSAETYYAALKLKLLHPQQVILMRGNHEGPEDLMPSPHDLPEQFQAKFGKAWAEAYGETRRLFDNLYNALLVHKQCLMVHGGLPKELSTVDDLAYAHSRPPQRSLFEEILWSDPDEMVQGTAPSPRGAGTLFGKSVTDKVLAKLNVKVLIRGHEPCEEGYMISHGGKVLTLFSRKGPPYFNAHGAYLDTKLDEGFKDAEELVRYIHKF